MGAEKWGRQSGEFRDGLAGAERIQQKQTMEAEDFGLRILPTARQATVLDPVLAGCHFDQAVSEIGLGRWPALFHFEFGRRVGANIVIGFSNCEVYLLRCPDQHE
jgi:hypothetical protein